MDTRPDDLNDLERRLAELAPAGDGLDADAMLFATGRASARPGPLRFIWPAAAACLALLAAGLGARLAAERGERLALAEQLRLAQRPPTPRPAPRLAPAPVAAEPPAADSLLASYRALEHGLDAWPAVPPQPAHGAAAPAAPALRAWPLRNWPDL